MLRIMEGPYANNARFTERGLGWGLKAVDAKIVISINPFLVTSNGQKRISRVSGELLRLRVRTPRY